MLKFNILSGDEPRVSIHSDEHLFIGRVPTINDVCVAHASVSRQHVHIKREGEAYTIQDLKSLNGLLLNGKKVDKATLSHGDTFSLGDVDIRVEIVPDEPKIGSVPMEIDYDVPEDSKHPSEDEVTEVKKKS